MTVRPIDRSRTGWSTVITASATLAPDLAAPALPGAASTLRLGYVPLTDAAPLLVADALGLFRRHGLAVTLTPVAAWAALRDRMAFGALDGAQMLGPLPIATALRLGGVEADLAVVSTLGLNGNTITLGETLLAEIAAADPAAAARRPLPAAALAAALAARRAAGRAAPTLAVVFPFSSHNYLLRYWLAGGGIDPDRDVRLVVVPPPLVAEALAEGWIDGFCSGEPWGSRAVDLRVGRIALSSADVWRNHPEKVLAVPAARLNRDPAPVVAAIAALIEAGRWLDDPANRDEAAALLTDGPLGSVPPGLVAQGLAGRIVAAPDEPPTPSEPPRFHAHAATFPFASHGRFWLEQMRRWRHVPAETDPSLPARIWRSGPWRTAAALVDEPAPHDDAKTEGGHDAAWTLPAAGGAIAMHPDRFIDGARFARPAPTGDQPA